MMSCGGCCVWPCFCSLFLLFLPSLSTSHFTFLFFLCTELLQVIATFLTLLKSKLHILNIGLCSMLVKMSSGNNTKYCVYECTIWAKCDLRRVYPYVPQFCAAYCTVLWSGRDDLRFSDMPGETFPRCNVMYKWRAVATQVWAVYSHYPPLVQLPRLWEGRVSVVTIWTLWVD